jgi:hypothetical protein
MWLRVLVVGALVLLAAALAGYLAVRGRVTEKSLAYSVARKGGEVTLLEPCRRRRDDAWRCSVSDDGGSSSTAYSVRVDGRCWHARAQASAESPRRLSGCVGLRDQIRLFDRLLGG